MSGIKKTVFFATVFFICVLTSLNFAQDDQYAERNAMFYKYLNFPSLVKGGQVEPHWMADKNSFWYAEGFPENTVIYKIDPKANTKDPLFDTDRLRQALTPLLGHEPPYKGLPFKEFTFLNGEKAAQFTVEEREFICQLETYKIIPVPAKSKQEKERMIPQYVRKGVMAGSPDVYEVLSPDSRWFLGTEKHNLYLRSTYDGRKEPMTADGIKDYAYDVEGAKWSPDSFKVAAYKIDQRKVPLLPLVHWLKTVEEVEWVHFTKAGGPMPQTEIILIDILSKRMVRLDTGDIPDQYIFMAGWKSDGTEFYFMRMDREWKKLEILAANPQTGSSRILLTETEQTFVGGPLVPGEGLKLIDDGKKFLWISERDGWAHIYLYDINGHLIRQLTKGAFPVLQIVDVDETNGWVYFTAHAEKRLYDIHLYRVNVEGQGFAKLTEAPGNHAVQFSPSKEYFLDTHSSTERPPVVDLREADGALVTTVSEANIDALKDLKWSPPEEFIVKAADEKTDLYGIMYKPHDFDPNKTYPVIDYIYNGPQTTWVPRTFTGRMGLLAQAYAQLGFVVFIVDGRGTPERSKEFQDVVYGNFGRNEIPDHVATLKHLAAERPYMDLNRVGIFGGSWGGYMTIRAMVLAPDVYHVGVSNVPVVDLYDQMALAIERYMGLPENNGEGYEYGSSLRLVDKIKGKLLMIASTSDVNATFSAAMKMVEALVRANKAYDLIVLPDQDHHATGKSMIYSLEARRRYFQEHLKPDS